MGQMRWVSCQHCGQTLFTDNTEKCDACGKPPGQQLNPSNPEALKELVARKQHEVDMNRVIADAAVETFRVYRMIVGMVPGVIFIGVGTFLTIYPPGLAGTNNGWRLGPALPGLCMVAAGAGIMGLAIWVYRRRRKKT
jgi:hypothetical protein